MAKAMLGKISLPAWQGLRNDLETKIAGKDGAEWLEAFKQLCRMGPQKFFALTTDTSTHALVSLAQAEKVWMSDNAKQLFSGNLGVIHKTELDVLRGYLDYNKIIEKYGESIIFDSVNDLEATISSLIVEQSNGEEGVLLSGSCANLFYVRKDGKVRRVCVSWHVGDQEWGVSSHHTLGVRREVVAHVFRNCGPSDA